MCPDEVFRTFPQAVEGSPTDAQSSATDSRPNRSKPVCHSRSASVLSCCRSESPAAEGRIFSKSASGSEGCLAHPADPAAVSRRARPHRMSLR